MRASTRGKTAAYVVAWVSALLATDPTGKLLPLIHMFPMGLYAFFAGENRQDSGWTALISALIVYVVQGILYFRARTTRSSVILFLVLLALLFCNVSGCHSMNHGH